MNYSKAHSLNDDDTFSNFSPISCGLQNSLHSMYNSEAECNGPVSVRDMIKEYNKRNETSDINHKNTYKVNTAKKYHHPSSQHLLASTKSSYCGLNHFGSNANCCNRLRDDHLNHTTDTCCKQCTTYSCCRNGSHNNSTATKILSSTAASSSVLMLQPNENNPKPNNNLSKQINQSGSCTRSFNTNCNKINAKDLPHILAVENCSNAEDVFCIGAGADFSFDTTTSTCNNSNLLNDVSTELSLDCSNGLFATNNNSQVLAEQTKNHWLSSDSPEETNICQQQQRSVATTYQSKTTIAKTSSGVRIVVDIYFDPERCDNVSDVVGSRVETAIPKSRILEEFQQQQQQQTMAASHHQHAD